MIYDHKMYQEDLMQLIREGLGWDKIKGKKILITGASGMIGTFLVDAFLKRNEIYHDAIRVFALSRNMKNLNYLKKYGIIEMFCLWKGVRHIRESEMIYLKALPVYEE